VPHKPGSFAWFLEAAEVDYLDDDDKKNGDGSTENDTEDARSGGVRPIALSRGVTKIIMAIMMYSTWMRM